MTSSKKKRMSMLDNLANAGSGGTGGEPPSPTRPAAPASPMMSSNRALRSARDAVDAHHVWELDPATISDGRMADRLEPGDVADLRDAIEANGQTVPILVRRDPSNADRYLLVYGRRRLEAIRLSDKVTKVRALVASMDDQSALRAQISENMARRDLSFIEKALFAKELVEGGFGNQSQVAEVLTVTKSSVSMAIAIVEMVGTDLIRTIGPAHGVGRPRWEALGRGIADNRMDVMRLVRIADDVHAQAATAVVTDDVEVPEDISARAFEAVAKAVEKAGKPARGASPAASSSSYRVKLDKETAARVKRGAKGVSVDLPAGEFADWVEASGPDLIKELHERFKSRSED